MNALTSYLRHLFTGLILLAVEKFKLPVEGAEDAANVIALTIVGTLSWLFAKYVAPKLKIPKASGVALFALSASLALLALPSCVNSYQVDGAGRDWEANPVQVLPANRVTPLADVPVPSELGGGFITVPIVITPTK